ncbi:MAG: HAMP domain-containing sensor histidine kinase [Oscillospiraceae bacterium]
MNEILLIITTLSLIFAITAVVIILLYKRQIYSIAKQIEFIQENDTNLEIRIGTAFSEVRELSKKINLFLNKQKKARRESERKSKEFKETITNISHDLRTPLTSVVGYIKLLKKPNISQEKRSEYLEIIDARTASLKKMLDQLFEFARIEANEFIFNVETVNVNNILCDTFSMFYDDFTKIGIEPQIAIPEEQFVISADKEALSRVFENVINNALKYGEDSVSVTLKRKGDFCEIEFKNRTDQIRETEIDQIFDRFYTSDRSRSKKTTGLGLSIAKLFVKNMGGEIWADYHNGFFLIGISFKL